MSECAGCEMDADSCDCETEKPVSKYPEHEKMKKISDQSQTIGQFLDWLGGEKEYVIAREMSSRFTEGELITEGVPDILGLLAEYFEIDPLKINEEKEQMLKQIRTPKESR